MCFSNFTATFEDMFEVTSFVKCKIESLIAQNSLEKPKEGEILIHHYINGMKREFG